MYGLIIGLCLLIAWFDVCLMVSKSGLVTAAEREKADQEQMDYLKKHSRKKKRPVNGGRR